MLKPHEIEAALRDTLEQTLAVGVDESAVAYEAMPNVEHSLNVVTYLARQQAIGEHIERLRSASVDPEWIIPKAAALAAFIAHFAFPAWHYVIDIGSDEITMVLVHEGRVIESRSLVGSAHLFAHIQAPSPGSDEPLRLVLQHLAEAILAYKERYSIGEEALLTVTGDASEAVVAHVIAEYVQQPLSPLHASNDTTSILQCACAIGAAFASQKATSTPIPNFRVAPFAFPSPFLHWKRPLTALCLGCLSVSALIAWYGRHRSDLIIEAMQTDWKKITEANHTCPEEVVRQMGKSNSSGLLSAASSEHIIAQGEWLLASVERMAVYPLNPNVPRLSDIMVWLTTQMDEVAASTSDANEKIEMQSLVYQLVKHPTKSHPQDHYQVRVDIEFSTPSVALARALHDRLASPNRCIDPSSEIKWTPSNGRYKASFLLKDATFYPPRET